eukprot:FR740892.1.p1 GENE.FR740892.1~~FR740892.1.p1  ORF type:complete len:234 (+),score=24.56 FR740892.1:30-704(+)
MLGKIIMDLTQFMIVFLYIFCVFAALLLMGHFERNDDEEYSAEGNPFQSMSKGMSSLSGLLYTGDIISFGELPAVDQLTIYMFLLLVNIILLNVLIAIVCDSYSRAISNAFEIYWTKQLQNVTEINITFSSAIPEYVQKRWPDYNPFHETEDRRLDLLRRVMIDQISSENDTTRAEKHRTILFEGVHLKINELHQALSALEAEQKSFRKEIRGLLKKRETGTLV